MSCTYDCFDPLLPATSDMARSVYEGDGATTDFQFTWDYLDRADWDTIPLDSGRKYSRYVRVYVGTDKDSVSENTAWTMTNSGTVRITPAPGDGEVILILRDSKLAETMVDFEDDGVLTQASLDLAYKHNLYLHQEGKDRITDVSCRINELCGVSNDGNGGPVYSYEGDCAEGEVVLDDSPDGPYGPQSGLGEEDLLVFINGVLQHSGWTLDTSGDIDTLTFDPVPTNTDLIVVKIISNARIAYRVQETGIADNSISTSKLQNGAVTLQKTSFGGSSGQVLKNVAGTWQPSSVAASEVTSLAATVQAYSLSSFAVPSANLNLNSKKITNLLPGTAPTDAATVSQIETTTTDLTFIQDAMQAGYDSDLQGGIMPEAYFRLSSEASRDGDYDYQGVQPKVALSARSASEKLLTGFLPRRIDLLISGQIRRNSNANVIHGWTSFVRTFRFVRWMDDDWFSAPNSGVDDGQYKTYTLSPLDPGTGASSPLTNITVKLEIDKTNYDTWLYIYGSGFGTELMRLVNPSDSAELGVIQILAERGA